MADVLPGLLRALALAVLGLVMTIIGLAVVWIALPYRAVSGPEQPFSQYPQHGNWVLVRLPRLALWWDNIYDGMYGDKRGWWANHCSGQHASRKSMWLWAAVRNPSNYFSRVICGVDVSRCTIVKVAGMDTVSENPGQREWQILKAVRDDGTAFPRFFVSWAITHDHALMIDIGWKVKLAHNGTAPDVPEKDRIKGSVFTLSPWKALT
jgi:hypothetical protein